VEAGVIGAAGAGTSEVLVTQMDPALLDDYFQIATVLRTAGINTEVQLDAVKIGRQVKYADRAGIPLVVLMGGDEQARGAVTLKHLASGVQREVPRADLVTAVRSLLKESPPPGA
jgi:histidyl-tRNA synthetase